MSILSIAIVAFVVIETLNVLTLYFAPGSDKGNGLGVFDAHEQCTCMPEVNEYVTYLINWVAGTKLIFIALLIVILITGDETTKFLAVIALILSILSFYWRLYPAIRRMDAAGNITPKGYSKTLGVMITVFVAVFVAAAIGSILLG